jgi:hypothetical protein
MFAIAEITGLAAGSATATRMDRLLSVRVEGFGSSLKAFFGQIPNAIPNHMTAKRKPT